MRGPDLWEGCQIAGRRPRSRLFHFDRVVIAVNGGISSIDFNQVMQQQHLQDPVDVNGPVGVFCHRQRVKHDVPAMFGRVFVAGAVMKRCATRHRFQLVGLDQEVQLLVDPFGHEVHSVLSTPGRSIWSNRSPKLSQG